ncbi:hypothetical protein ACJ41O_011956 [Fusarium nematophilum]
MSQRRHFSGLFSTYTQQPIIIAARKSMPRDPASPSVAQLPDPVVQRILTFLHVLWPEYIRTVALLNSSWYEQARYVQHRHVHVNLDRSRHVLDRLRLISRLGQLVAIRTLQVSGREYDQGQKESNDEILAYLAAILPAMTGLRDLDWDVGSASTAVPVSAPILAALPAGVRLRTFVFCHAAKESHIQARAFLRRLVGNQRLCTLSVQVTFLQEQDCLETMRVLKEVLLSCPNLTRLPRIDVWYPRGGCIGYGPPLGEEAPYCGLGLSDGKRPPALEELGLRDYPWGLEGVRHCQGYPARGYEWDYWAETFDWSRLVRLNYVSPTLTSAIAPRLTSLRELVVDDLDSQIDGDFLQNVTAPLELMVFKSWDCVNSRPELINRFGETLRELKIHEPEGWPRSKTPTATDLVYMSKCLPHLENLSLDIARDQDTQDWPYKALEAIAAFPSLRIVELWFPLGREPPAPAPLLTASSAGHLFHYLREQSKNKTIRRVTFHSGAPTAPSPFAILINPGLSQPSWAMHNSVSFVCDMAYNGESLQKEVEEEEEVRWPSVSCPELSTEMNARLHVLAQEVDRKLLSDPRKLNADTLRLRVALHGPLVEAEWEAWKDRQRLGQRKNRQGKNKQSTALQRFILGPFKRAWKR